MIPADIDMKQFKTTRVKEGYDQDEVDNFLDAVTEAWREDLRESEQRADQLKSQSRELAEMRRMLDAYGSQPTQELKHVIPEEPSESAAKILKFAQRTADDVIDEARRDADELMVTARNEAERHKNDARGVVYQLEQEVKALEGRRAEIVAHLKEYLRRSLNGLEESGG